MPFSWVYLLPKNSGAECQFLRKILMYGNILLGNRPNFFVEHMTKSQNQPYRFKSEKYISMGKITDNVKKENRI